VSMSFVEPGVPAASSEREGQAGPGGNIARGASSGTPVRCVFWVRWRGPRAIGGGRASENHGPCPGLTGRGPALRSPLPRFDGALPA
jgi:hypothetical protein